ncbi:conserved exported hypothetical protein [Nitrospina gracilis 3/211]|uniref:Uncharacterized protein n=1 Tax=Nitrospina gracilis (strain 3/211) TaxID=1266370 RepID=M1YN09_NITG3|nr:MULTISPECIES: outer membrane protein assembly factor BamE [Nitrospina]MCF8722451.1 hypothetical protein [Nitrospina sp. Nb-3]CCQ91877.1 conserved exported hypothetical protein [Nitrospina gracilis 3/211]
MDRRRISLFAVLVMLAGLTACGTVGRDFDNTNVENIHNNVTTKAMIEEWFGEPHSTGLQNGLMMWTYQYDRYSAFGKDCSKELVVLFDANEKVKAYRYSTNIEEDKKE